MLERLVETFCAVDDFCKTYLPPRAISMARPWSSSRTISTASSSATMPILQTAGGNPAQTRTGAADQMCKNVKALPLTLTDKLLLNARNVAETAVGHIKAFSSLNFPKHRAPSNAFLHLLAALATYQLKSVKPRFPSCLLSRGQHKPCYHEDMNW
jgi:hypothetical protein